VRDSNFAYCINRHYRKPRRCMRRDEASVLLRSTVRVQSRLSVAGMHVGQASSVPLVVRYRLVDAREACALASPRACVHGDFSRHFYPVASASLDALPCASPAPSCSPRTFVVLLLCLRPRPATVAAASLALVSRLSPRRRKIRRVFF